MRSIVTGCHDVCAVHGKAPLAARESTRPTSNGVNLRNSKDNITGYRGSDNCRIDAVSIGRDPMSRPCVCEVHADYREFLGE